MNKFELVTPQLQIEIGGKSVYLNHYPFLCFGGAYRGQGATWQLFGHVHTCPNAKGLDSDRMQYLFPSQYDVGVDFNDFKPISWQEVKNRVQYQIDNKVTMLHWIHE